ncbi:uncharacterized protein LOC123541711 [Mercenaria mercenaria]|uniref:uncharacterized protein LOC123541711 n=1 Tax=Mercenaria mercenaria TaxID=6596 RepID=UPI00234FAB34|nr:uncharacterized protein LOC123541711 [Mercenaria mercenaria]
MLSEFDSIKDGNDSIPELLHSQVVLAVDVYKDCFQRYTIRRCAYNEKNLSSKDVSFAESVRGGFYPFVIREVFDKENVLALVLYDKSYNMVAKMKRLLNFLSLGSPTMDTMNGILQDEANQGTKK